MNNIAIGNTSTGGDSSTTVWLGQYPENAALKNFINSKNNIDMSKYVDSVSYVNVHPLSKAGLFLNDYIINRSNALQANGATTYQSRIFSTNYTAAEISMVCGKIETTNAMPNIPELTNFGTITSAVITPGKIEINGSNIIAKINQIIDAVNTLPGITIQKIPTSI